MAQGKSSIEQLHETWLAYHEPPEVLQGREFCFDSTVGIASKVCNGLKNYGTDAVSRISHALKSNVISLIAIELTPKTPQR